MTHANKKQMFLQAMKDPASVYQTPDQVLQDHRMTPDEKRKILDGWALDQQRLLTSESENMPEDVENTRPAALLQEISKARSAV